MLLLDLKADEARRKVGRDPAGTTDESLLFADFHIHTVRSDGLKKPSEILERAIGRGLTQIAFLDHNTVMPKESLRNLEEAYRGRIRLISGSEIPAFYADGGKRTEVHIGALGIDSDAEICFRGDTMSMEQFLQTNRPDEEAYITEMSDKLRIETDAYAHYAAMDEVVKIIIEAKGVPVLCHPLKYGFSEGVLQKFVRAFAEAAAGYPAAIEAGYRKYSQEQQRALKDLAKAEGLFLSTGSDFHGRFQTDDILSPEEIISGGCAGTDHVGYLLRDVLGESLHGSDRSGYK